MQVFRSQSRISLFKKIFFSCRPGLFWYSFSKSSCHLIRFPGPDKIAHTSPHRGGTLPTPPVNEARFPTMWAYGLWLLFDYYCSFNGLLLNTADGRLMAWDGTVINGSRIAPSRGERSSCQGGNIPEARLEIFSFHNLFMAHLSLKKFKGKKQHVFNSTSTTEGLT